MDKSMIGLIAALGAVAPLTSAQAAAVSPEAAVQSLRVNSVAELLEPVPNAVAVLAALDSAPRPESDASTLKGVRVAQWHHHHHHHHHYYHHHHHHHHFYGPGCWRTPIGWVCP
jgi:hypothetical protein